MLLIYLSLNEPVDVSKHVHKLNECYFYDKYYVFLYCSIIEYPVQKFSFVVIAEAYYSSVVLVAKKVILYSNHFIDNKDCSFFFFFLPQALC